MRRFEYIEKEIAIFEQLISAFGGKVVPCTKAEVNELESMLPASYHLPGAYREFLLYGGKKMGSIFGSVDFSYNMAKILLKDNYQDIYDMLEAYEEPGFQLPDDIFVINDHLESNFTYFFLKEGENPPVYWWSEDEGSLKEASKKDADSFSQFLMQQIEKDSIFTAGRFISQKIKAKELPRGQQFWIPNIREYSEGIQEGKLMQRLGFGGNELYQASKFSEFEPYSYLEELSGWKARQVGSKIRFFPPSYKSPEEKAYELLNQIESKRKELAKVEKRIANFQNRIKNLSGGKLRGINFNNASTLRIKELELDLRKQKVLKQKLEKEIAKLEENSN